MLMFVISVVISFANSQYLYHTTRIGLKIKSILMALIYEKSLRLRQSTNANDVTLISIETNRFVELLPNFHMVWSIPLTILICLAFLVQILGLWSTFTGLVTLLLTISATYAIGRRLKTLQSRQMAQKDRRLYLANEIIGNIKVIQ
jgi:ABC-type bacteriocin/lantibiotic exporter with double-glycine peptidase domain